VQFASIESAGIPIRIEAIPLFSAGQVGRWLQDVPPYRSTPLQPRRRTTVVAVDRRVSDGFHRVLNSTSDWAQIVY